MDNGSRGPTQAEILADIDNRFRHHSPPDASEGGRLSTIRCELADVAKFLSGACPPGRELSLALTNLEQVMFWANAAIARQWP